MRLDCVSCSLFCYQGEMKENRETRGSLCLFLYRNRNRAEEDEEKGVMALLNS